MEPDHLLSLGTNLGTMAIVLYAIKQGRCLLEKALDNQHSRQAEWFSVQKELELARIDRGANVLGAREIRIASGAQSAGDRGTPRAEDCIG